MFINFLKIFDEWQKNGFKLETFRTVISHYLYGRKNETCNVE